MTLTGDFVTGQTVPFQRLRQLLLEQGGGVQEGVIAAGDLMVTQRGAGANMSVDVAAGAAWVQIDTGTRNGLCHVTSDAVANVTVTASNGTNPRIDQIILRYNDTSIPTGSGNTPTLEVLTGTATSGATLANRTGAAALPNDCLRLADILVPAASSSVTNANIRDRRPWARGAYARIAQVGIADYTTTSTTAAVVDATNLGPRVECSGAPLRVRLIGLCGNNVDQQGTILQLRVDGALVDTAQRSVVLATGTLFAPGGVLAEWDIVPAAGSHKIEPWWAVTGGGGTSTLYRNSFPVLFTVEELVRQNTANNTVTSG